MKSFVAIALCASTVAAFDIQSYKQEAKDLAMDYRQADQEFAQLIAQFMKDMRATVEETKDDIVDIVHARNQLEADVVNDVVTYLLNHVYYEVDGARVYLQEKYGDQWALIFKENVQEKKEETAEFFGRLDQLLAEDLDQYVSDLETLYAVSANQIVQEEEKVMDIQVHIDREAVEDFLQEQRTLARQNAMAFGNALGVFVDNMQISTLEFGAACEDYATGMNELFADSVADIFSYVEENTYFNGENLDLEDIIEAPEKLANGLENMLSDDFSDLQ